MAKLRQLYTIVNEEPSSLTVFNAFQVDPSSVSSFPIKVVIPNRSMAINIKNGQRLVLGVEAFLDPEEALLFLRGLQEQEIEHRQGRIETIDTFLVKLRQLKLEEKEEAKNAG
jgi:hypothetical protein